MPSPNSAESATSRRARANCVFDRATTTVPPTAMSASIRSASATRTTSVTASRIAPYCATAASRPSSAARVDGVTGNSAEHQPPLRPEAPNPAISASITATRSMGWAASR